MGQSGKKKPTKATVKVRALERERDRRDRERKKGIRDRKEGELGD